MKHHAFELFGFCLGLLGLPAAGSQARPRTQSSDDGNPSPIPECAPGRDRPVLNAPVVQIGAIAFDRDPRPMTSHEARASGKRGFGPARIIASAGL